MLLTVGMLERSPCSLAVTISSTIASAPPAWFPLRWQLDADQPSGLQGLRPLPWWSAGWYAGELRQQVLGLRRQPDAARLTQLIAPLLLKLQQTPPWSRGCQELLLVPVPSGRRQGNPVPALLADALAEAFNGNRADRVIRLRVHTALLQRNCRVAIQHHLNRRQRWRNQWLSFRALVASQSAAPVIHRQVLLVDDVLTSGATALAAQQALQSAGWHVAGLVCLGRTPR